MSKEKIVALESLSELSIWNRWVFEIFGLDDKVWPLELQKKICC